ncbi:MAG: DNA polymerase III subunit gamma/tau [Candidatus Gastranaerophilaceae bacterium]
MSKKYIPLYTKYRPMVFADITGQDSTVKALSNAIKTGRIMNAYLFCGPRGTGKTSSARIFAKSLNCENGPTVTPCGKCPGCLDVINSTSVDVIEIDAASNRSVEDARNILEKVQYAPLNGKYKIYIIDEVHMLTTEASNTLLKTLEEPPENVIFILATTESHKVLETIVSRCQRYDFRRITTEDIVKRLRFIAESEKIGITDEALFSIAKNTAGGMRDAVSLLDQLSVLGQDKDITIDDVDEILGRISYDTTFEIAECILNSDTESALKLLNEIHDKGNEPSRILTALIQYFRDMLILKSCSDKNLIFSMTRVNEGIFDKLKKQSEKFDNQTLIWLEDRLSYHFEKLRYNTNKYMWTELCIIDLTSISKVPTVAELTERVKILEEKLNLENLTTSSKINSFKTPIIPAQRAAVISSFKKENIKNTDDNKIFDNSEKGDSSIEEDKTFEKAEVVDDHQNMAVEENKTDIVEIASDEQDKYSISDEEADWRQITAEIKGPAKFFYSQIATLVELNKHKIVLAFSNESGAKSANDASKKKLLQDAACKYFDVASIQIEIKVGDVPSKKKSEKISSVSFSDNNHEHNFHPQKPVISNFSKEEKKEENQKTESFEQPNVNNCNSQDESFFESNETLDLADDCNDVYENLQDIKKIDYNDISDTARNIVELFGGKIID